MHRRTSLALVAFLSSATLIAGCGSSSSGGSGSGGSTGGGSNNSAQAPETELSSAVTALADTSNLTATLKLGATGSDITAFALSKNTKLTAAQATAIAGAAISIQVSAPSGKTLGDLGNGTSPSGFDLTVSDNGTSWISLRVVDKTLYLQADLKDLLNTIGQGSTYASLQSESAALPSFVQALFAGKWISLPSSAAKSLVGTLGAGAAGSASANPAQQQQVLAALKTILTNDVKVTRVSAGSTDKLALSANVRTLATDFVTALKASVPAAASALGSVDPSTAPDAKIALSAEVTGGALSELSIDLGQFDRSGNFTLPLNLGFTRGGSAVSAPSGAVAVDTTQLTELFSGLAGGLGG